MNFAVIGVNHKTCPIEVREKVAFTQSKKVEAMKLLIQEGLEEVVILSTCNRSEIYISTSQLERSIEAVKYLYRLSEPHIVDYLFIKTDEEALQHLYEVAAGLDSIVLGEDQILGQVKEAMTEAMVAHTSGKVLNKIFREVITTAKQIKTATKMSEHALSISRIAVKFLKQKQGSLKDKTGLIIGAGKMNELTIKYLLEEEVGPIYVMNRTHTKAVSLTDRYTGLIPIEYEMRYEILKQVDYVVAATASPHIILQRQEMPVLEKTIDLMDIAMPRDIDPTIDELELASVYDIDDLKAISEANNEKRHEMVEAAQAMIAENKEELKRWLESLSVEGIVAALNQKCQHVSRNTFEVLYKKLDLEEAEKVVLEKVIQAALKKMVREPIAKLMTAEDETQREDYAKQISDLFNLAEGEVSNESRCRNKRK